MLKGLFFPCFILQYLIRVRTQKEAILKVVMCRMNLTQKGMFYSASWWIITRCGRLTIYNIVKTIAVCFETTRLHDQAILEMKSHYFQFWITLKKVQYTICSVLNVRKLRCNLNSFLQHEIFRNIWVGGGWGGVEMIRYRKNILFLTIHVFVITLMSFTCLLVPVH